MIPFHLKGANNFSTQEGRHSQLRMRSQRREYTFGRINWIGINEFFPTRYAGIAKFTIISEFEMDLN